MLAKLISSSAVLALLLLAACKEVAIITRFHVNNRDEIAVVTNT
jgi:hypothetical protein